MSDSEMEPRIGMDLSRQMQRLGRMAGAGAGPSTSTDVQPQAQTGRMITAPEFRSGNRASGSGTHTDAGASGSGAEIGRGGVGRSAAQSISTLLVKRGSVLAQLHDAAEGKVISQQAMALSNINSSMKGMRKTLDDIVGTQRELLLGMQAVGLMNAAQTAAMVARMNAITDDIERVSANTAVYMQGMVNAITGEGPVLEREWTPAAPLLSAMPGNPNDSLFANVDESAIRCGAAEVNVLEIAARFGVPVEKVGTKEHAAKVEQRVPVMSASMSPQEMGSAYDVLKKVMETAAAGFSLKPMHEEMIRIATTSNIAAIYKPKVMTMLKATGVKVDEITGAMDCTIEHKPTSTTMTIGDLVHMSLGLHAVMDPRSVTQERAAAVVVAVMVAHAEIGDNADAWAVMIEVMLTAVALGAAPHASAVVAAGLVRQAAMIKLADVGAFITVHGNAAISAVMGLLTDLPPVPILNALICLPTWVGAGADEIFADAATVLMAELVSALGTMVPDAAKRVAEVQIPSVEMGVHLSAIKFVAKVVGEAIGLHMGTLAEREKTDEAEAVWELVDNVSAAIAAYALVTESIPTAVTIVMGAIVGAEHPLCKCMGVTA